MLRFFDGFDYYATGDILTRWTTGSATVAGAHARTGAGGIQNPAQLGKFMVSSGDTCIVGFAINWAAFTANMNVVAVANTSFVTFRVIICGNADGTLTARISGVGGIVLGTTTWIPTTGVWYYLEVKMVFNTVTGSVLVRVIDPAVGLPETVLDITNADTTNGGGTTWGTVTINNLAKYDDLYVCDGSGGFNNDFLGDSVVEARIATADSVAAGFNHGLTPSTGTDHGAMVDDATPNGDTDYNAGATAGLKDTYHLPATVTSSGNIAGVQVHLYTRKSDQAAKSVCPVLRRAGTDFDGQTVNLAAAYGYVSEVFETDPNTSVPWIGSAVNAIEPGEKIVT